MHRFCYAQSKFHSNAISFSLFARKKEQQKTNENSLKSDFSLTFSSWYRKMYRKSFEKSSFHLHSFSYYWIFEFSRKKYRNWICCVKVFDREKKKKTHQQHQMFSENLLRFCVFFRRKCLGNAHTFSTWLLNNEQFRESSLWRILKTKLWVHCMTQQQ